MNSEFLHPMSLSFIIQSQLQFLCDAFESICQKFKCLPLVMAEYKRRTLRHGVLGLKSADGKTSANDCTNGDTSSSHSFFCLFREYKKIKVKKFNIKMNCLDEITEILSERGEYGTVLYKNKIYVTGGLKNWESSKSVSSFRNSEYNA